MVKQKVEKYHGHLKEEKFMSVILMEQLQFGMLKRQNNYVIILFYKIN